MIYSVRTCANTTWPLRELTLVVQYCRLWVFVVETNGDCKRYTPSGKSDKAQEAISYYYFL